MDNFSKILAAELNWPQKYINNIIQLLDEGSTIPFIARYRKEMTGEMDETKLRELANRLTYLRNLEKRKEEIINSINEQGKLTDELRQKIEQAKTLQEAEDLYLPYRQKRKTRASLAKERGLEPLAIQILSKENLKSAQVLAQDYLNDMVETIDDALNGASDIIAEMISDDADIRKKIRHLLWQEGILETTRSNKEVEEDKAQVYTMYFEYEESVRKLPPHRVLAINRGEQEDVLSVKLRYNEEKVLEILEIAYGKDLEESCAKLVNAAEKDSLKRLLIPALERDIRNQLTENGEEQAIKVFEENLHSLLLQPPIKRTTVLGVDPGYRTGCKLAVVDDTGKVLEVGVMYPHPPQKKYDDAKKIMGSLIEKYQVDIIAIGNGTASRESEALAADVIKDYPQVRYIMVSEAGASVYSASPLAKEEFPQYDLSLRSAVSIARRLQDPLAELVKIEPKAVGVGQYQHDVTPKKLDNALHGVVEDCVNSVGVEVNTASIALLEYVAGLSKATAKGIVQYREKNGKFTDRKELLSVPRLGPKAYEQCAGFIRIFEGNNPLDNTSVHPESYLQTEKLLQILGFTSQDIHSAKAAQLQQALKEVDVKVMAKELEIGEITLKDIINALLKPGRDPREELEGPILRSDVLAIDDLTIGMELKGTVRNVVDFGAFVDIGIKNDGLVHISQMTDKYIKHPLEVVSVGDIVTVKVLDVDTKRSRVALTMK